MELRRQKVFLAAIIFFIIALVILLLSVRTFAAPTYREQEAKIAADEKTIEKLRIDLSAQVEAVKKLQAEKEKVAANLAVKEGVKPQVKNIAEQPQSPEKKTGSDSEKTVSMTKPESVIMAEHRRILVFWGLLVLTIIMAIVILVYPGVAWKWHKLFKKNGHHRDAHSYVTYINAVKPHKQITIVLSVAMVLIWIVYIYSVSGQ